MNLGAITRIRAARLTRPTELTLALKGREREARIEELDELLIRLRVLLRLAADSGRLRAEQYAYVLGCVDNIGRQLGAWRRSLGPA